MGKYDKICPVCGIGLWDGQNICPNCSAKAQAKRMQGPSQSKSTGGCLVLLPIVGGAIMSAIYSWLHWVNVG